MERNDWFLAAAIFGTPAALALVWILLSFPSATAAAWVQAIGSIAAIVASAFIATAGSRSEKKRTIEARRIAAAAVALSLGRAHEFGLAMMADKPPGYIKAQLSLPQLDEDEIDWDRLTPELTKALTELRTWLQGYQWIVIDAVDRFRQMHEAQRMFYRAQAEDVTKKIKASADRAASLIEQM